MNIVCGLDECGRGPLAGPLVAAGVVLAKPVCNLKDSKKLTPRQLATLYEEITQTCTAVNFCVIPVYLINRHGIGWANKKVFELLIGKIKADKYIVDGNLKIDNAISIIKADNKVPEVMAASIVAKVTRDRLMRQLHKKYPHYGWDSNVGYGTRYHIEALRLHGPCIHHRKLFVRTALSK